jgi:hypothetical protein
MLMSKARPSPALPKVDPFLVNRKTLFTIFGSPRLAQRMIAAGWITVVRRGGPGRETLFDRESANVAFERLKGGEEPPLLACETRGRKT